MKGNDTKGTQGVGQCSLDQLHCGMHMGTQSPPNTIYENHTYKWFNSDMECKELYKKKSYNFKDKCNNFHI